MGLIGSAFYLRSTRFMERQMKTNLRTAAALGAMQFHADELETIRTQDDMQTAVFHKVVAQLRAIREGFPSARFTYIFRRTDDPAQLQFVADADALSTLEELDENGNGTVDTDEEAGLTGDLYDIREIPELQYAAFEGPVAGNVYVDQWGALVSGFAPIRTSSGEAVGVLGIDVDARDFVRFTESIFSPTALLLLFVSAMATASYIGVFIWLKQIEHYERLDSERAGLLDLSMHQIGSPLAALKWWTEILRELEGTELSEDKTEAFEQIQHGIDGISSVMKALTDASNARSRNLTIRPEPVSLTSIVESVGTEIKPALDAKRQTLSIDFIDDARMNLDRKLIVGVIHELLSNASVFSPEGTTIKLHANNKGKHVHIEIKDRGIGIPAADLPDITHAFKRGGNASVVKPVGNGLGLFVARGIVERAGGQLWIESIEGKGTSVFVQLPRS